MEGDHSGGLGGDPPSLSIRIPPPWSRPPTPEPSRSCGNRNASRGGRPPVRSPARSWSGPTTCSSSSSTTPPTMPPTCTPCCTSWPIADPAAAKHAASSTPKSASTKARSASSTRSPPTATRAARNGPRARPATGRSSSTPTPSPSLPAYRARRAAWRLAAGTDWPDTGLFFVRPDGHPWHPNSVTQRFRRMVKKVGLPPIRLHDLRHGAATIALDAGVDIKVVSGRAGASRPDAAGVAERPRSRRADPRLRGPAATDAPTAPSTPSS
jgi:hypothetical protein